MRFTVLALAALTSSLAAAQTTTGGAATPAETSKCNAQNIVDACKEGIQKEIDKCGGNEWICLCDNYTNLATCYNNCPEAAEKFTVEQQVQSFCQAAEPLKASSSAHAATAGTSAPPSQTSSTASATESDSWNEASNTADPQETGAAGSLMAPAGGFMAALLGFAALL